MAPEAPPAPAEPVGEAAVEEETYECPECGTTITPDMATCPNCGVGLTFEDGGDESTPAPATGE
jgi:N utilization substance protein A